jgi:hypothetical protein
VPSGGGDKLGYSVSGAGDMNNDGFDDVIMEARGASNSAGAVYVIFGKAGGYATVNLAGFVSSNSTGFIIWGAAGGDNLGRSVSGAGDVNGDGSILRLEDCARSAEEMAREREEMKRQSHNRTTNLWNTIWGRLLLNPNLNEPSSWEHRTFMRRFRLPYQLFKQASSTVYSAFLILHLTILSTHFIQLVVQCRSSLKREPTFCCF